MGWVDSVHVLADRSKFEVACEPECRAYGEGLARGGEAFRRVH
jgi:hypothetical protein